MFQAVDEFDGNSKLCVFQTTNDPVVFGCFYPFDDKILITFGKQHMYFWTVFWNRVDGRILRDKKSGLFEVDNGVSSSEESGGDSLEFGRISLVPPLLPLVLFQCDRE